MSKLVIRKRVSLDFLGEDYKEAYVDFRALAVSEYSTIWDSVSAEKDQNQAILNVLKSRYVGGKFPGESGELEDIDDANELDAFDVDCVLECFGKLTGQNLKRAFAERLDAIANGAAPEDVAKVRTDVDPKSVPK